MAVKESTSDNADMPIGDDEEIETEDETSDDEEDVEVEDEDDEDDVVED